MMQSDDETSVTGQLAEASRMLAGAGVETPRNDAKLLLAEAFGVEPRDIDKAVLFGDNLARLRTNEEGMQENRSQTDSLVRFRAMLARRAAREPLQYIVGHAPFRFLDLKVGPGVFIPRPETETVVQAAIDWLGERRLDSPQLVDLCAGSGAIGLSLVTEVPNAEVWAVEQSAEALAWTRRNRDAALSTSGCNGTSSDCGSAGHDVAHADDIRAVDVEHYHLVQGDAMDSATLRDVDGTIDAVVTNPPYVPIDAIPEQSEVRDHDPAMALYGGSADGLRIPERIIDRASMLLRQGGLLVMEHDIAQGEALVDYARSQGFVAAHTGNDLTGRPRYLMAEKS